jgi:hypothetical protein
MTSQKDGELRLQKLAQLGCRFELREGIRFLKAELNVLERLQIVRGRNSSYFGSK